MEIKEIYEWVRRESVRSYGTDVAVAVALNSSPQRFNARYVNGKHTPIEECFDMITLLYKKKNIKTPYPGKNLLKAVLIDLVAPLKAVDVSLEAPSVLAPIVKAMLYFDRVEQAVIFQNQGGERRGRLRKNGLHPEEKNSTCVLLNVYTDAAVVKKYGFSSVDTFRRAKKIWKSQRYDLMQAVHVGLIDVNNAKKLLAVTVAEAQAVLSSGDKRAIRTFIKERGLK